MTTATPTHTAQPMPGQVVQQTLRSRLLGLDKSIRDAKENLAFHAEQAANSQACLAELNAAHAEITDFLAKEAAKA
ncbi:MAG TPA: hypothetical protein VMS38_02205 [Pseudorhodoferax sp.]|nr:hypothetical protein [Pseudorhodoferax sp.]